VNGLEQKYGDRIAFKRVNANKGEGNLHNFTPGAHLLLDLVKALFQMRVSKPNCAKAKDEAGHRAKLPIALVRPKILQVD
jgi:hypothetical protein